MPKLNDADSVYIGAQAATAVMLGSTLVWGTDPGGGGGTDGDLGDTGTGGGGNWPTSGDRALMRKITVTDTWTLTQFNMWLKSDNIGVGERFKGIIYQADSAGGGQYPGTLVGVSSPTNTSISGACLLTAACTITLPPGTYWIGYVCNGLAGAGCSSDSGGVITNNTIMLNGGEVNYASPPSTAGVWPGSPGPYSNTPSLWFDGTYV